MIPTLHLNSSDTIAELALLVGLIAVLAGIFATSIGDWVRRGKFRATGVILAVVCVGYALLLEIAGWSVTSACQYALDHPMWGIAPVLSIVLMAMRTRPPNAGRPGQQKPAKNGGQPEAGTRGHSVTNTGTGAIAAGGDIGGSIVISGSGNTVRIGGDATEPVSPRNLGQDDRIIRSETATAAKSAGKLWNVPYPRNPFFTGRDDVLARLRANLLSGTPAALTQAISGLGGIGKTQTAVEYAYRHRGDYAAVLWLSAASTEALTSGFADLARLLELREAAARDQAVTTAAVQRWLRENVDWLLILDNADDIALARQALPGGLRGHIIITTRATALGGIAEPLRITKLSAEEGAEFLLRRGRLLGPEPTPARSSPPLPKREGKETEGSDRAAAGAIAKELDGLPLALDQAGAYLEETPATPSTYLALLRARRGELLASRGSLGEADHASVTVTYSLALEKVELENPASADLLRLCAFLSPDAIPEEILTAGAAHLGDSLDVAVRDDLARAAVIRDARKWSLLDCDPAAKTLGLHRLVQAVVRETMNISEQRAWAERAILALNAAFPYIVFSNWPLCDRLAPHAQAVLDWIDLYKVETSEASRLLNQAGYYLKQRAQYAAAEPLYQRALAIYEKALGPDHPLTATSLNNLATVYDDQGNYAAAEPLYQRALAIDEKALGPDHPDTATDLNNLAGLYDNQGNYAAAEPLYQRALAIREKALGPDHPDTAQSLNNLAELYRAQDNYAAAEPLYQRSLAIREKALGPGHPSTATGLNNLALLYKNQGNYAAAEPLYQRALAIREKALGPDHPDTATSLNNLALLYDNQGSYAAAEPLYQRALAIYDKALGPGHPLTINCRRNYEIFLEEKNKR